MKRKIQTIATGSAHAFSEGFEKEVPKEKLKQKTKRKYYPPHDNLGPTGHGDICWSDADPGL